jgi:hypothetical protein
MEEHHNRRRVVGLACAIAAVLLLPGHAFAITHCFCGGEETEPIFLVAIQRMRLEELILTVMLALMASFAVAVIVERALTYHSVEKQNKAFVARALTALHYNRPDDALDIANSYPKSPVAAVVRASTHPNTGEDPASLSTPKKELSSLSRLL